MTYTDEFKKALARTLPDLSPLAEQGEIGMLGYSIKLGIESAQRSICTQEILKCAANGQLSEIAKRAAHLEDCRKVYRQWLPFCPPELCPRCNGN